MLEKFYVHIFKEMWKILYLSLVVLGDPVHFS